MNLKAQRAAALKAAHSIVDGAKAAGRALTADEVSSLDGKIAEAEKSAALLGQLAGLPVDEDEDEDGEDLAAGVIGGARQKAGAAARLVFGRKGVGEHAARHFMAGRSAGSKAVGAVSAVAVPVVDNGALVAANRRPLSIFDVVPVAAQESGVYVYRRQLARNFAAGIVPPGEVKPASSVGMERVEERLRTFAHLSDPLHEMDLCDAPALARFLGDELLYGLQLKLEEQVIDGTGAVILGDTRQLTGLLATSGVLAQTFSGDEQAAWVLNSTDWVQLTTARTASGAFDFGSAVDVAERKAWGVPVVLSNAVPVGTAVGFAADALQISTDRVGVEVLVGRDGDDFSRNQVRARAEGRFNLDVYRPAGVVTASLTLAA